MASWLEISLTVDGELAEAVADVLARFAPNGVVMERQVRFETAEDMGTPGGLVAVRAYLPADEQIEDRRQKLEEALWYLGRLQPLPDPTFIPIAEQDWMEAWKEHYQPIPVGKRLIIVPTWLNVPDGERIPIRIDPGMAFGTGTHPTTQLCLELLEQYTPRDKEIIDLGCGSGILSIAALKLGAGRALGVDLEAVAIESAKKNAQANRLGEELTLAVGSLNEIQSGKFALQRAPLVVANILAHVLIELLPEGLVGLMTMKGKLMLSGILEGQAESVVAAAQAQGLRLDEQRQMGDWVAQVYVR